MKNKSVPDEYLFPKGYTNYIFILLFALYMFDYIDRMVVTSMFTSIKNDWGLDDAQVGMLVSAVYWSIVILTFPISILVDRWSRRKTIAIMATIWSFATALCALTGNFTQLLFTRVLIGIGEAGYAPGGTAMIAALYPQRKRAQMIGVWNASIPLGSAIGVAMGGLIASYWGWKHAFGLVAIPGLIISILFFFVKDYKTINLNFSDNSEKKSSKPSSSQIANEFLSKPSYIFTCFGIAAVIFVTTALITWLPRYLEATQGLNEKMAGLRASLVFLLAIVGAPLGGYLTDRWRKYRINARLLFPAITTAISSVLLFLALDFAKGVSQYFLLLIFGMTVTAFISAASAVTQDVIYAGLRASAYAIAVLVQNFLGASIAPVLIGILIDATNISKALSILPIMLLVGSALFYMGSRHYEKDYNKVKVVEIESI